jgi:hypothetical protein
MRMVNGEWCKAKRKIPIKTTEGTWTSGIMKNVKKLIAHN